jgi:hypothetical protein
MDTSSWFRPPVFREFSPPADFIWYTWIAEPSDPRTRENRTPDEKFCFGVAWMVSDQLLYEATEPQVMLNLLKEAGRRELFRRVADPEKWAQPEGSLFEAFLWTPVIEKLTNPDGTFTTRVQEPTC